MSDLPKNLAKQDSSKGPAGMEQLALIADASSNHTWVILFDAADKSIILRQVDNTGAAITTQPSVEIDLSDLSAMIGSTEVSGDFVIKLRETKGCDDSGNAVYAMVLRSKWYTTPLGSDFT